MPKTLGTKTDIRASHGMRYSVSSSFLKHRGTYLIVSDIISILLAWQIAQFLNQFYSPLPSPLVWWTWFGYPSVFWLFVIAILVLFSYHRLYNHSDAVKDYAKAAQLISYVYIASLLISYFYDPHLDLPRSLFASAWLSSIVLVVSNRVAANLFVGKLFSRRQPVKVFLIAAAERLQPLAAIVHSQPHYVVVGAAIASTAQSAVILQSINRLKPEEVVAESMPDAELASRLFWRLRSMGIVLRLLPSSREMMYRRGVPEIFASLPTLKVDTSFFGGFDYLLKRGLDFCLSMAMILMAIPL